MTQHYVGTKIIEAWPAQKDGTDGYSVKCADGYISWSPKDAFDAAYLPLGRIGELPAHVQRMVGEWVELDSKVSKLGAFVGGAVFQSLPEVERLDLAEQLEHMVSYALVLRRRIERAGAA